MWGLPLSKIGEEEYSSRTLHTNELTCMVKTSEYSSANCLLGCPCSWNIITNVIKMRKVRDVIWTVSANEWCHKKRTYVLCDGFMLDKQCSCVRESFRTVSYVSWRHCLLTWQVSFSGLGRVQRATLISPDEGLQTIDGPAGEFTWCASWSCETKGQQGLYTDVKAFCCFNCR